MYGIFTNIYPINDPNVGKYITHGSYGIYTVHESFSIARFDYRIVYPCINGNWPLRSPAVPWTSEESLNSWIQAGLMGNWDSFSIRPDIVVYNSHPLHIRTCVWVTWVCLKIVRRTFFAIHYPNRGRDSAWEVDSMSYRKRCCLTTWNTHIVHHCAITFRFLRSLKTDLSISFMISGPNSYLNWRVLIGCVYIYIHLYTVHIYIYIYILYIYTYII